VGVAKIDQTEGWDSLTQLRLIMEIEEYFEISVLATDIPILTSYQKILKKLKKIIINVD
jgi:acyl carrier protein